MVLLKDRMPPTLLTILFISCFTLCPILAALEYLLAYFEVCKLHLSASIAEIEFVGFLFHSLYCFCIISGEWKKMLIYITLFISDILKNDLLKIKSGPVISRLNSFGSFIIQIE